MGTFLSGFNVYIPFVFLNLHKKIFKTAETFGREHLLSCPKYVVRSNLSRFFLNFYFKTGCLVNRLTSKRGITNAELKKHISRSMTSYPVN